MSRAEQLKRIQENPSFDVLVIGGGINGIGTFRDLALQGLRILLVEKGDFAEGASAEWLPQETIVIDRAMVKRDLQVRLAVGATFTGIESVVLGRAEMGETVQRVWLRDGWRIWRGDTGRWWFLRNSNIHQCGSPGVYGLRSCRRSVGCWWSW